MARRGRKSKKNTVEIGWREVWIGFVTVGGWVWHTLSFLKYLNPVHHLMEKRRRVTVVDREGTILYLPPLSVWLLTIFTTETSRRKKLLGWVQELVSTYPITNLSTTWHDGVAMCALLEAVCPGACPRFDLLKPQNKVNNCRVGLKLAQKHLNIPQTIITPDEMATVSPGSKLEERMFQLLMVIKCTASKHAQSLGKALGHNRHGTSNPANLHKSGNQIIPRPIEACTAKGTGLIAGVVGKMCKFNVFINIQDTLILNIDIKGPNGEVCNEKIMSFEHDRRPSVFVQQAKRSGHGRIWNFGARTVRFWQHRNGLPIVREHSLDYDETGKKVQKIPFDYQCVSAGHLVITYIPKSAGAYTINIKWHDSDVRGSPFTVNIAESIEKLNERSNGRVLHRQVSIEEKKVAYYSDDKPSMSEEPKVSKALDHARKQLLASIRPKTGRMQKSANVPARQATVTRRRVLRRVVTKAGQEIVIHEAPPSSMHPKDKRIAHLSKPDLLMRTGSPAPKKQALLCGTFDYELSYESDVSTRTATPEKETEHLANSMASTIMNGVFQTIDSNKSDTSSTNAKMSESPEPSDFERKDSLQPPMFDDNFKGSPFPGTQDNIIKPKAIRANPPGANALARRSSGLLDNGFQVITSNSEPFDNRNSINLANEQSASHLGVPSNKNNFRSSPFTRTNSPFDRGRDDESESLTSESDSYSSSQGKPAFSMVHEGPGEDTYGSPNLNDEYPKFWTRQTVRKTNSDPSVRKRKRPLVGRSLTCPDSPEPRTQTSNHSSGSSSPGLRIIQSDSQRKSCVFISQKAITESLSQSSTDQGFPEDPTHVRSLQSEESQSSGSSSVDGSRPLNGRQTTINKLKHSMSLPNFTDDDISSDTSPDLSPSNTYPVAKRSIGDLSLSITDFRRQTLNGISLQSHTPTKISPAESPYTASPMGSACTSRRASLVRQDVVLHKLSEESLDSEFKRKLRDSDSSSRSIQSNDSRSEDPEYTTWLHDTSGIRVPKAKVDRTTQVTHDEIKQETGYTRPLVFVRHRRTPVKLENTVGAGEPIGATEHVLSIGNSREHEPEDNARQLPNILHVPQGDVRDDLVPPMRQSTVETTDSGIADERLSTTPPTAAATSTPSSGSPRNELELLIVRPKPCYVNGHRVVSRRAYRRLVSIDAIVLRGNSPNASKEVDGTTQETNDEADSLSDDNRSARPSDPDHAKSISNRRHAKYSSRRRRVTFSRRVLMYRRSSSKSSRTSSRHSKDSIQSPKSSFQEPTPEPDKIQRHPLESYLSHSISNKTFEVEQWITQTNNTSKDMINMGKVPQIVSSKDGNSSMSSLEDNYTGFGICKTERKDFLSELSMLSGLSPLKEGEVVTSTTCTDASGDGSVYKRTITKPSEANTTSSGSETCMEVQNIFSLDSRSTLTSEGNDLASDSLGLPDDRFDMDGLGLNIIHDPLAESVTSDNIDVEQALADIDRLLETKYEDTVEPSEKPSAPSFTPAAPKQCQAFGIGLTNGQVTMKNNFQVLTEGAGNGYLTVSIMGPRPYTVLETSVTYTGDNMYEVIYEVTKPGYYIINVKWADFDIPDSPYVCHITY